MGGGFRISCEWRILSRRPLHAGPDPVRISAPELRAGDTSRQGLPHQLGVEGLPVDRAAPQLQAQGPALAVDVNPQAQAP